MRSLASSFFVMGRIKTTEAKAKEVRPFVERCITRAKNPTVFNRRQLASFFARDVVKKIFEHGANYSARKGGYTRIIKVGPRMSDGARMAFLELVTIHITHNT